MQPTLARPIVQQLGANSIDIGVMRAINTNYLRSSGVDTMISADRVSR
jgi:hypothetical protein